MNKTEYIDEQKQMVTINKQIYGLLKTVSFKNPSLRNE